MQRFQRLRSLQKFASVHDLFNTERSLTGRNTHTLNRGAALAGWGASARTEIKRTCSN